jgi:hypothetical protein
MGGGAVGCLLAAWGTDLLIKLYPDSLPRLDEVTIDFRVLGVGLVVTLFAGIVSGLAPALQTSKPDLISALKQGGRGTSALGVGARRLRSALVVSEIALSLMLIVGAGLLLRSFGRLMQVDSGFNAENVLTIRLRLPDAKYRNSSQTMGFSREALRRVSALRVYASLSTGFPFGNAGEQLCGRGEPEALPGRASIALTVSGSGITIKAGHQWWRVVTSTTMIPLSRRWWSSWTPTSWDDTFMSCRRAR